MCMSSCVCLVCVCVCSKMCMCVSVESQVGRACAPLVHYVCVHNVCVCVGWGGGGVHHTNLLFKVISVTSIPSLSFLSRTRSLKMSRNVSRYRVLML